MRLIVEMRFSSHLYGTATPAPLVAATAGKEIARQADAFFPALLLDRSVASDTPNPGSPCS